MTRDRATECRSCGTRLTPEDRHYAHCLACRMASPTSGLRPCARCGSAMQSRARSEICKACLRADQSAARLLCRRCGKPTGEREAPSRQHLCSACSGESYRTGAARRKAGLGRMTPRCVRPAVCDHPINPARCPRCEGLPWRRGEGPGEHCRTCGHDWEPECLLGLSHYAEERRETW